MLCKTVVVTLTSALWMACVVMMILSPAHAAIPLMINHQGLVKVNSLPFTGNGLFKFGLVDSSGSWLWTNDGSHIGQSAGAASPTAAVVIPVNNGIYNVGLGDTSLTNMVAIPSSVFDSADVTLRVIFNDSVIGEQILAPDQPITSAAYAFHAADSDTVGGKAPADLNLVGEVKMWAGPIAAVPSGWFPCDGRELSRTTYADLFAALGSIYGVGDGSTTFNIPDMRDRSPMGARQDDSGVPKTNVTGALTQTGGEAVHTLTVGEMPAHSHGIPFRTGDPNSGGLPFGTGGTLGTPVQSEATGGGQSHNILDPYVAITFIIKY